MGWYWWILCRFESFREVKLTECDLESPPVCRLMLAALVVLILMVITSCTALFCCCFATDYYGLWLQAYHRKDLFCLRVLVSAALHSLNKVSIFKNVPWEWCHLCAHKCSHIQVQNGLALYTTWTSIASLINFSLVLQLWGVAKSTAATASLCILFAEVVAW